MKSFVLNNWYKMVIAFSAITFSSSLLIYSFKNNTAQASPHFKKELPDKTNYQHIIASTGKIFGIYYDVSTAKWEADYIADAK